MQTFLPLTDFRKSADVLDGLRRRNQRNECKIILNTRLGVYPKKKNGRPGGWPYHPATRMWSGYEASLCRYSLAITRSCIASGWLKGGYVEFFESELELLEDRGDPPWLGDERIHLSHRSNLIRKYPEHYRRLWPDVPDNLPYIWPTDLPEFEGLKENACSFKSPPPGMTAMEAKLLKGSSFCSLFPRPEKRPGTSPSGK